MVPQCFAEESLLFEQRYFTVPEALDTLFPDATRVSSESVQLTDADIVAIEDALGWDSSGGAMHLYKAYASDELISYAIELNELGKYFPITFMVKVSKEYVVEDALVLVYREKVGASVRKRRFLKQFFSKDKTHPFMLNLDVDGITGATISSATISSGIKKAILVVEQLQVRQLKNESVLD